MVSGTKKSFHYTFIHTPITIHYRIKMYLNTKKTPATNPITRSFQPAVSPAIGNHYCIHLTPGHRSPFKDPCKPLLRFPLAPSSRKTILFPATVCIAYRLTHRDHITNY